MFEIIKGVFNRNSEYLEGDTNMIEKARKIMIQIVNALTVKQEIGAPFASLYLLGNPDHYTNYLFKPFFWTSYVNEARTAWSEDCEMTTSEGTDTQTKVIIGKVKGNMVAISPILDYTLRPEEYAHMSLYDWIRTAEKYMIPKERKGTKRDNLKSELKDLQMDSTDTSSDSEEEDDSMDSQDEDESESEDEGEDVDMQDLTQATLVGTEKPGDGYSTDSTLVADDDADEDYEDAPGTSSSSESDESISNRKSSKRKKKQALPKFLTDHPHHDTHSVRIIPEVKAKIPSFIGVLPRPDKGNYDDYCLTMLALFKPWRSGKDLKDEGDSWEEAFKFHQFTERQSQVMQFMNIRHECYDARDDFKAQRIKAGTAKGLFWIGGKFVDELDKANMQEEEILRAGIDHLDNAFDETNISNANLKKAIQMAQIEAVMDSAGWLDSNKQHETATDNDWTTGESRDPTGWKNLLAAKRAEILAEKMHIPPSTNRVNEHDEPMHQDPPNDVIPIYKSYLTHDFAAEAADDQKLIDSFVKDFTLNEEQERAFRIIANHSVSRVKDQLQMYIGGMGGTGKSQVIKALTAFFEARGKKFAFLIMAPTGTAAALISDQMQLMKRVEMV
ncbi:hypothetical protein DENSPDRAFT_862094 [Dentipellis sp. KUC8613]|nr:hypothetical protein DENSPDRAFT_862094 [Dentipellis sp. KUC8613]